MPLAELSQFHDSVPIIPDSGLQFLDFGVTVGKTQPTPTRWGFYADKAAPLDGGDPPIMIERDVMGDTQSLHKSGRITCEVDFADVEALFCDQWVPLPLLRRDLSGAFFRGPTNWARVYLHRLPTPDDAGRTHRVVLALDTRLAEFIETEAYVAPCPADAKSGRPFALPGATDPIDWYLQESWVRDWCVEAAKELVETRERAAAGGRPVQTPSLEQTRQWMIDESKPQLHLAAYRALLDWLHAAAILPHFVIVDRATEGTSAPIDVDLVLDLGNSRSCGLLIESDPGEPGGDVTNAVKLRLRDLSRPYAAYSEPFSSRIEFNRAAFGRDHLSLRAGLGDRFSWPSIVRIGPEAERLSGLRRGSEGASSLSSPKRYLWDEDARRDSWRFNSPAIRGEQTDVATGVAFTTLVNDWGEALHRAPTGPGEEIERSFPSIRALYARRNLMSFALAEVLLQALCQMNAPAHRVRRAANERLPRRLRRLIMTMPTAMPLAERQILEEQAKAACELAYMALGLASIDVDEQGELAPRFAPDARRSADKPFDGPEVRLQWDEASATQAIYFYTQIAVNYSGDARSFFNAQRHPINRADPEEQNSLRVATLDMGGGTTDLVVTRLTAQGSGAHVSILPEQLFREGFCVAGDDGVHRVARDHVLETIKRRLTDGPLGRDGAEHALSKLFGGDRGDMGVTERLRRQQFAAQIAAPIAIAMLTAYEGCDPADPPAVEKRAFDDFFRDGEPPPAMVIDYIDAEIRRLGDPEFSLRALSFPIDMAEIDRSLRAVFLDMLQALGEMVWRHRCDLLLLSGRPSRLPAVQAMMQESGCLAPGRIIPLHRFRVGGWYPFRDAKAAISDPKTTAAVGAMICLLSEGRLTNFNFRSSALKPASTARYFGKLDRSGRLLRDDAFFTDMKLDDPDWELPEAGLEFHGPMPLGFRQMAADWWPASRLYQLAYAEGTDAGALTARTPFKVRLKRDRSGDRKKRVIDKFVIQRIEDREGRGVSADSLRLRLQTMDNQSGYWLDTGVLLDL